MMKLSYANIKGFESRDAKIDEYRETLAIQGLLNVEGEE